MYKTLTTPRTSFKYAILQKLLFNYLLASRLAVTVSYDMAMFVS
jgi:hypothetical protein